MMAPFSLKLLFSKIHTRSSCLIQLQSLVSPVFIKQPSYLLVSEASTDLIRANAEHDYFLSFHSAFNGSILNSTRNCLSLKWTEYKIRALTTSIFTLIDNIFLMERFLIYLKPINLPKMIQSGGWMGTRTWNTYCSNFIHIKNLWTNYHPS